MVFLSVLRTKCVHLSYLTLAFTLAYGNVMGQFRSGQKMVGAKYQVGKIVKHRETISHLITEFPVSLQLTYDRKTHGTEEWEKRFNFPDIGLTFIYTDFRNPVLGRYYALLPTFNFYTRKKRDARYQFIYRLGFGPNYSTETYDRDNNNKNSIVSTKFSFGVLFEAENRFSISKNWQAIASINFTHFSNGAIRLPNRGINVLNTSLGVAYLLDYDGGTGNNIPEEGILRDKWGLVATLAGGFHEAVEINAGTHPFFVLSAAVDKQLNRKSTFSLGLDWFYSVALKKFRVNDYTWEGDELPDFNRVGIFIGHDLRVNEVALFSQLGYYLYDPYSFFTPIYFRLGLKYNFSPKVAAGVAVKSHGPTAEAVEFLISHRIK